MRLFLFVRLATLKIQTYTTVGEGFWARIERTKRKHCDAVDIE
jgi:hypothetical protein